MIILRCVGFVHHWTQDLADLHVAVSKEKAACGRAADISWGSDCRVISPDNALKSWMTFSSSYWFLKRDPNLV